MNYIQKISRAFATRPSNRRRLVQGWTCPTLLNFSIFVVEMNINRLTDVLHGCTNPYYIYDVLYSLFFFIYLFYTPSHLSFSSSLTSPSVAVTSRTLHPSFTGKRFTSTRVLTKHPLNLECKYK